MGTDECRPVANAIVPPKARHAAHRWIDPRVSRRLQFIMPQAEILLRP